MTFDLLEVIAVSSAIFRNQGFLKKGDDFIGSEKRIPNSTLLYNHFCTDKCITPTTSDYESAQEIINYMKGLSFKAFERDLTSFESNVLKLVTELDVVKKDLGIAASLPKVYANKLDQDTWEVRERELAETSEYVGTVRTRCDFDLVIENIRYIKTTGASLYCCSVDGKHVVKFFSDNVNWGKVGDRIQVAGYVKSQAVSNYSGGKETMINRIKEITSDG